MTTTTIDPTELFTRTDQWGEKFLDMPAIAAALAPLLNGSEGEGEPGRYGRGVIQLDGWSISLRPTIGKGNEGKITASGFVPNIPELHYSARRRLPEAKCSLARGIEAVAKDIDHRVIEAAIPILQDVREKIDASRSNRAQLEAVVQELKAHWPSLRIDLPSDKSDHRASFYGAEPYVSGHVSFDGRVTIDRIGSIDVGQFRLLLAAIA